MVSTSVRSVSEDPRGFIMGSFLAMGKDRSVDTYRLPYSDCRSPLPLGKLFGLRRTCYYRLDVLADIDAAFT